MNSIARKRTGAKPGGLAVPPRFLLVPFCLWLAAADAQGQAGANAFPELKFSASEVSQDGVRVQGLQAGLAGDGAFTVHIGKLLVEDAAKDFESLELTGNLARLESDGTVTRAGGQLAFKGLEADWRYAAQDDGFSLCLQTTASTFEQGIRMSWPEHRDAWVRTGDLELCLGQDSVAGEDSPYRIGVDLDALSFDSPEGRFAGEGLTLELLATVRFEENLQVQARGFLQEGQVLIDSFYGDFTRAPLEFSLSPDFTAAGLDSLSMEIRDDGALHIDADLLEDKAGGWFMDAEHLDLVFPGAYRRYLEPFAASLMLDGLEMTGGIRWNGMVSTSGVVSGDLDVSDLSVVDVKRERFALTGLSTRLRPGDDSSQSAVGWSGLLLGPVNLGAGSALLDTTPGAFALASPLQLDVLNGQLRLDRLRYVLPGSPAARSRASRFELQATISEIDVGRLTAALGWPRFDGTLSGSIPGVRLEDGVLQADGEMRFEVFDGEIVVDELSAERLFGVLPSFAADVRVSGLDLEQLTGTFEFGSIGGRLDGRVNALRLLDWRPVSFEAWLGTPESQARSRSISRRAVRNLTAIGGGSGTAALSNPLLRMFSSFSYRRLGLGCRLENHVCHVTGLDDDGESVLLLEGAGIPRITVRAWNRSVDWPRMVDNLLSLPEDPEVRVGDAPDP